MGKGPSKSWFSRLGLILVSVALLSPALGAALRHRLFYQSFWGGPVFAPMAFVVGLFLLYLTIFRWKKFREFGARKEKQER